MDFYRTPPVFYLIILLLDVPFNDVVERGRAGNLDSGQSGVDRPNVGIPVNADEVGLIEDQL